MKMLRIIIGHSIIYAVLLLLIFIVERKLICPIINYGYCTYIPKWYLAGLIAYPGYILSFVLNKDRDSYDPLILLKKIKKLHFLLVTLFLILILIIFNLVSFEVKYEKLITYWLIILYPAYFIWLLSKKT